MDIACHVINRDFQYKKLTIDIEYAMVFRNMGEMADWTIEQIQNLEDGFYEEEPDEGSCNTFKRKKPLICSRCKESKLIWRKIKERWVIFNLDGSVHTCKGFEPPIEILREIAKERRIEKMSDEQAIFGTPFENYTPPFWDEWFIKIMYLVAEKSKDPKTKIGALIVRDKRIISTGYNGLCKGVNDNVAERLVRPEKYSWFEHGERNAIYSAAKYGICTNGTIMYTNGTPCIDCARAVIQAGIAKVVVHKPYEDMSADASRQKASQSQWKGHNDRSMAMFNEAGVILEIYPKLVGSSCYFDGKRFIV